MNILVINAGSSSLKFQLLENSGKNKFRALCKGIVDGIGLKTCQFRMEKITKKVICNNHREALKIALDSMILEKIIPSLKIIDAVGHRVVHGGEKYRNAAKINAANLKTIRELCELAPLHNPHNLKAIEACQKLLPGIPQVAVFDTAFHETLEPKAYMYPLPYELYSKHGIRRYGFHGTSHQYVSEQAAKILKNKKLKIASCHLGNGSSVTAIVNGKSVDTSMGLTPLEGVPMGTRSGDIDSAIIFHLLKQHRQTPDRIENMLMKESGLKGLSGISSDMRDVWAGVQKKNPRAQLALQILCYRIAKYIGSYAAAMNGLDVIIFTAGIGENAWYIRRNVCEYLNHLGLRLDPKKNKKNALTISSKKSKVKVLVIPTNEEEQIAKETLKVLNKT